MGPYDQNDPQVRAGFAHAIDTQEDAFAAIAAAVGRIGHAPEHSAQDVEQAAALFARPVAVEDFYNPPQLTGALSNASGRGPTPAEIMAKMRGQEEDAQRQHGGDTALGRHHQTNQPNQAWADGDSLRLSQEQLSNFHRAQAIGTGGQFPSHAKAVQTPNQGRSPPRYFEVTAIWQEQDTGSVYQRLYVVEGTEVDAAIGAIIQKHVSPRNHLVAIAAGSRSS